MAHIAQGRLRQPVFAVVVVVAAHPTVIAGNGVVAAVRIQPAQPLVTDLTGFHILVARRQFLDPVHQVVLVLMVDLGEERVAPGGLLLEVLFLHRRDDGVIAQLAVDVHLRLVVVAQPDAVELLLVDAFQEGEGLVVIAHGGALEGLQCQTVSHLCLHPHPLSPVHGLAEVVEGRIVHKRLVALIETERPIVFLLRLTGMEVLLSCLFNLPFVLSHNLRGLLNSLVYFE